MARNFHAFGGSSPTRLRHLEFQRVVRSLQRFLENEYAKNVSPPPQRLQEVFTIEGASEVSAEGHSVNDRL